MPALLKKGMFWLCQLAKCIQLCGKNQSEKFERFGISRGWETFWLSKSPFPGVRFVKVACEAENEASSIFPVFVDINVHPISKAYVCCFLRTCVSMVLDVFGPMGCVRERVKDSSRFLSFELGMGFHSDWTTSEKEDRVRFHIVVAVKKVNRYRKKGPLKKDKRMRRWSTVTLELKKSESHFSFFPEL